MNRRPIRILLVEDDHEDAFLFQRRCPPRMGVHHVTTARMALSALAESAFDVCFVDYQLGAENGLDLVRAVRSRHAHIPLVVITGQQIEVLGENALLAGATDFIPKEHLDTPTIERTVRWALIRRHVEVRHGELDHAAIVTRLMGRAPTDTRTRVGSQGLRRLAYLSVARQPMNTSDLLFMSSQFAAANARMGIAGVLAYAGEKFLQVIEGSDGAVEVLLRRIEADDRHMQMHVILDEPTGLPLFDGWRMDLLQGAYGASKGASPEGASEIPALRLQQWLGDSTSRSGIERLLLALPSFT